MSELKTYGELDASHKMAWRMGQAALRANADEQGIGWCRTHTDTWTTVGACRNGVAEREEQACRRVLVDLFYVSP